MIRQLLSALAIAAPATTLAHPGGLDSLGCHNDRRAGGYHCHSGSLAGRNFESKSEAIDALQSVQGGLQMPSPLAIIGRASVIDGDTIEIHGKRIRLFGIDAPESAQTCRDDKGQNYRCGQRAALMLSDKIGQQTVVCDQRDVDRYKRIIAVCRLGNDDLNAWLVREGWAVAYRQFSRDYVRTEEEAKAAKRGIWAGTFTPPEE